MGRGLVARLLGYGAKGPAAAPPVGFVIVPVEPTETMWGGLARDLVFALRHTDGSGAQIHKHLRSIGREIPAWLLAEIPDTSQVQPKGTLAAVIYKAMVEARPKP